MYKFTNGVIVFTKEDRDNFLKAGYTLVEEKNENKDNSGTVAEEPRECKKPVKKLHK